MSLMGTSIAAAAARRRQAQGEQLTAQEKSAIEAQRLAALREQRSIERRQATNTPTTRAFPAGTLGAPQQTSTAPDVPGGTRHGANHWTAFFSGDAREFLGPIWYVPFIVVGLILLVVVGVRK